MKTKLMYVLFLLFLSINSSYSQSGKVGINTSNPTRSFDINGDFRVRVIRDTTGSNLNYLVVDDSGNVYKVSLPAVSSSDTCPPGFASVNDEYCIEKNERSATTWWNAIQICGSLNAHLCEIYEWYFAALNGSSLGMSNLTGNWEWIGDTAAGGTVRYVGLTSIKDIATAIPYDTVYYEFRCCKSK